MSRLDDLEMLIAQDHKLLFTFASYGLILVMYVNLSVFQSFFLGVFASVLYFLINSVFLGRTFFEKETTFFRLIIGALLLIAILGLMGLLAVIIYNLDLIRFPLVLFIATTISSALRRRVRN